MDEPAELHVALISSPGLGHIIPVLFLGDRLVTHHGVRVTVLVVTTGTSAAESQAIAAAEKYLSVIKIPPPDISGIIDHDAKPVTRLGVMMQEARAAIRSTISAMDPRPNVLVGDFFSTESWSIAEEFHIPKYVFVTTSAWFLTLTAYCPIFDNEVVGEYVDQTEPLKVPGCKPVRPEDVVDPMLDRSDRQYQAYLRLGVGIVEADGILVNTWEDLERETLNAVVNNNILRSVIHKPVYPIGPIYKRHEPTPAGSKGAGDYDYVMEWLDTQPERSVLYVSFGSGGTMSAEQMAELAYGLESSGQRFVWVVRPPTGLGADKSFFTVGNGADDMLSGYFPEGFLTRTQKMGLVIPSWAPQVTVLNHPSVGGFLTHSGWNSTMESISRGVPMIVWPLYAEQRLNATILTEEFKVAVRPGVLPTKKVVERGEIEKMVRTLMESEEGKAMREMVEKIKRSGEEALSVDNGGGSSYNSMCDFIEDCWSRII